MQIIKEVITICHSGVIKWIHRMINNFKNSKQTKVLKQVGHVILSRIKFEVNLKDKLLVNFRVTITNKGLLLVKSYKLKPVPFQLP